MEDVINADWINTLAGPGKQPGKRRTSRPVKLKQFPKKKFTPEEHNIKAVASFDS
jgi:hypothetical protein